MKAAYTFTFFILLLSACSKQAEHEHAASETYTCPMHPEVVSEKAGTCPVCGMDLVKVNKSTTTGGSNDLMLTDSQIKLANVTTQRVSRKPVGQTVLINGRFAVNEQNSKTISTRSAGRIEKLNIKQTGQAVKQGEALYTIYSETLLTLQQEYLLAKEQYHALGQTEKRYKSFFESSEKKLLLYGLTRTQLNALVDRSSLKPTITFLSPASGIVTEVTASEGQYVPEGAILYRIEDVTNLWVEAELYPGETDLVKVGDKVSASVNDGESQTLEATVTFLSPEFRSGSQIVTLRATIDNKNGRFKPGQQVQIYLTHSTKQAISIPVDAVIRDGRGAHVYRQAGNNTFEPVMVKTGIESFDQVEIKSGISEGDTVAVSGAYLLYSELILKKGTDPMAGHNH